VPAANWSVLARVLNDHCAGRIRLGRLRTTVSGCLLDDELIVHRGVGHGGHRATPLLIVCINRGGCDPMRAEEELRIPVG